MGEYACMNDITDAKVMDFHYLGRTYVICHFDLSIGLVMCLNYLSLGDQMIFYP